MMVMAAQVNDVMNSAMSGAGTRKGAPRVNDTKSMNRSQYQGS